jgi:hypothetical protein
MTGVLFRFHTQFGLVPLFYWFLGCDYLADVIVLCAKQSYSAWQPLLLVTTKKQIPALTQLQSRPWGHLWGHKTEGGLSHSQKV